jgi:hypothetical protein
LPHDEAALVGLHPITVETLATVQQQSELNADDALKAVIDLRVLGRWAANGGLEQGRRSTVERSLLSRYLLERIQEQVQQPATASDAEIHEVTQSHWVTLDRPEAWRVTHCVVTMDGTTEAIAQQLAQRIVVALKGVTKAADFIEKVRAIPTAGLKVVVEALPPVTADGRSFEVDSSGNPAVEAGRFDSDFAQAASRLKEPGTQSGIVRTRFGFHVLLLEERIRGYTMPLDERRKRLWPDVLRQRAQGVTTRLLDERRRAIRLQSDRSALEWTGRVKVNQ